MSRRFVSAVGRPLDPAYPSNLFVLVAAPAAGAAWLVWKMATEGDWSEAFLRAFTAGGATFLAWTVARELDPDRPWTAGVAAVAAAAIVGAGPPSLLVAAAVMLAARIAARTTGLAPRTADLVPMALLAAGVGATDGGFMAGVALGGVLVADRWLPGGARAPTVPLGLLGIAGAVVAAALWGILEPSPGLPSGPEWVVAGIAVLGLLSLGRPRSCTAPCDYRDEPVTASRVRVARLVAAAAAALTFVWLGGPGLTSGSAVWAALAAVALPTLRRRG
jgi:hypothetical protein